ncbi:hypothetical protein PINS_up021588 [Pythium insidiosum]|nr:hypothetical protein PINS_up021588 [Pythium insidiosum]
MQRFVENYPAFRSQSVAVSKHVTLMGELARLVEVDCLMDVSQLEQELACSDEHNAHFKDLVAKLKNAQIKPLNKLRLAILYVLRYETNSSVQIKVVKDLLLAAGLPSDRVALVDCFLKYGGSSVRAGDLYGDRGLKKFMRAVTQGVQGVPNVYAQHVPPLIRHLETIMKGNLLDNEFGIVNARRRPASRRCATSSCLSAEASRSRRPPSRGAQPEARVAGTAHPLGGTFIHNSSTFLAEVADAYGLTDRSSSNGERELQVDKSV